ncbi:ABC transporter substrate-binding protein [Desulfogranum japonicum]|uniref:ABC transporter substrate-binding protein n=1 Tax=Desulfogranum japonicum TaxID=231447 RepID=UPI000412E4A5|nr:ABC transporter substrate-binding protein [Desulfogranum japonicum]
MRTSSFFLLLFLLFVTPYQLQAEVITDSDKRTHVFEKPFTRIISLYPAHTRNLMDMGAADTVIAVGRSDKQLPDRPRISYRDDPERFIALKPDLVLIRPMISRSYPQLIERLELSGIRVISLQPAGMDELFDYWEKLGSLTGYQQASRNLVIAFSQRLKHLQEKVNTIPAEQRKQVYFEAIHRQMKTFAKESIAMFVLETAGGINIATDATQMRTTNIAAYGKERLLAKAEQVDVFLAQQGRMNPVTLENIYQEPGFSTIKAIRNKQVYLVDEHIVSRPTMDILTAAEQIMDILYPDMITEVQP